MTGINLNALVNAADTIDYINDNFNQFVIDKERRQNERKHEVDFDDFFIIDDIL